MPWWVGYLSLGVAAALLIWSGLPSGGRRFFSGWLVLGQPWCQNLKLDVQLTGRFGALALSILLAGGCTFLAFGPGSFLVMEPALVGMALFGTMTVFLGYLLWTQNEDVKLCDEIHLNPWAIVVVGTAVIGLVLLAL